MPLRRGTATEFEYLQSPLHALSVVGMQPRRGHCVHQGQPGMLAFGADPLTFGFQFTANCRVGRWQFAQAIEQRSEIQQRAADQHRHSAATANRRNCGRSVIGETGSRVRFGRIENIDQVMRDTGLRVGIRLGTSDIHAPVDLRRVDADDLGCPIESRAQRQRQAALAGRSGAGNGDDRRQTVGRQVHGAAESSGSAGSMTGNG